ncbi:hypothetical protein [Streptomyces sp. NPDC089173]|uniref:STAS domain-containing protein n=1 Tax=unclassified Streptomyces TaxID=2593676 RepID=UPI0034504A35
MESVTPLLAQIETVIAVHGRVILDASGVTFADSSFLRMILGVHQRTDLRIVAPPTGWPGCSTSPASTPTCGSTPTSTPPASADHPHPREPAPAHPGRGRKPRPRQPGFG